MKGLIAPALILFSLSAQAAVPHTFTANTPARASEVNANFTSLDQRVETLENNSSSTSQGEHTVTFTPKTLAVGGQITLAGRVYQLVEIPFKDFETNKTYHLRTLMLNGDFETLSMSMSHTSGPSSSNITIDGTPANARIFDSWGIFIRNGNGVATRQIEQDYDVNLNLQLFLPNTSINLFYNFSIEQQDKSSISRTDGNLQNHISAAQFNEDPNVINAIDEIIDYIRVIEQP